MKVLVIAVLALVAAIHATPYLPSGEIFKGYGGRVGGYGGRIGGYGGRGGGYGGGSEYGHSGSNRGDHGYLDEGYGSNGFQEGHDIRHQENEFDKSVHEHHVSDQNTGGVSSGGRGGHVQSGHGSYGSGVNDYGRGYDHGYNYGIL